MQFRLVKPVKREGTNNRQFSQRIPADVKARAVGLKLEIPVGGEWVSKTITAKDDAIRLSLKTFIPEEVKARQAQVLAYLGTVWGSLRKSKPVVLTFRQATALAGELYAAWAAEETQRDAGLDFDRIAVDGKLLLSSTKTGPLEPGLEVGPTPDSWEGVIVRLSDPDADPEPIVGPLVTTLLLRKGIVQMAPDSRPLVVRAFAEALRDASVLRQRQATGDYSPDPKAARFPEWVDPSPTTPIKPTAALSLTGIVEDWWREAEAAGRTISTYESYRNTMARFVAFLGHDDALAVTAANVVGFKNRRLAGDISPKTVGDSDVAGLRSVFNWAVGNKKLANNPAVGIRTVRSKVTRTRGKEFTTEEAKAVLTHSLNHRGRESPKLKAAKRWVPWVCAYSGARVGEIVQLRKKDVRQAGDVWVITITPEAGTVKDKEVREVVIHDHLIAQGFLAFVDAAPDGHLFLTPRKTDGEVRGVWRSVKNRLREFVREVVKDKKVQPNHAWRHTFKTLGREAGIADSVLDAICGHAAKTVGGAYGSVTLKTQAEAMGKFPRFPV